MTNHSTEQRQAWPLPRAPEWIRCAAIMALCCGGCSSESGPVSPGGPSPSSTPVLVSNAVPVAQPAYVSLPPGSVPGGTSATILNVQTGSSIVVAMRDGGFDPVPVDAIAGDSMVIEVEVEGRGGPIKFALRVPEHAPPIVVRTEPAKGKRDVPLNARIVIVFSEPIGGATLTSAGIHLRQGAVDVAGDLRFMDDAHLTAEFVPDAPLSPGTDYALMITQSLLDLDGDPLAAPVSVEFATASATASFLAFITEPNNAALGEPITPAVTVAVQDASGRLVTGFDDTVTITLAQNPGGVSLGGTTRAAAVQGVATFPDLRVQAEGTGYRLAAEATGVVTATSGTFQVAAGGAPANLRLFPTSIQVHQGSSANARVIENVVQGVGGVLSMADAPAGVTATFHTAVNYQFVRVDVAASVAAGQYRVVILSTGSARIDSVEVMMSVLPGAAGFRLQLSTPNYFFPGAWSDLAVNIVRTTEAGPIRISASAAPPALGQWHVIPWPSTGASATLWMNPLSGTGVFVLRVVGVAESGESQSAEAIMLDGRAAP